MELVVDKNCGIKICEKLSTLWKKHVRTCMLENGYRIQQKF